MSKIVISFLSFSYLLGQIARIQIGNIAFTLLDLVVGLSLVLWLVNKLVHREKIIEMTIIVKLLLGFLGIGLLSLILYSTHLSFFQFLTALLYPLRLIVYLSLFFQARDLSRQERKLALILMLVTGFLLIVLGYVQYSLYPVLRNLYYLGWDEHLYRMFATFLDPNFAGAFFAIFSLFAIDCAFKVKKRFEKGLCVLLSLSAVLAVFLTYSRTGIIMLVVGISIYMLVFINKKFTLLAIAFCLLLLAVTSNTRIEGLNPFRIASSEARIESAQHAMTIIQKYPAFGVGFNAYRYVQVELGYREEYTGVDNHADAGTDNSYLFVLATTGILGGITFVYLLFYVMKKIKHMSDKNNFPARSLLASMGSILIGTLFLNIIFYPMIIMWVVLQAGFIRSK